LCLHGDRYMLKLMQLKHPTLQAHVSCVVLCWPCVVLVVVLAVVLAVRCRPTSRAWCWPCADAPASRV